MGLLDFLTSTKRPVKGTLVLSKQEVVDAIMSLNSDKAPYRINYGDKEHEVLIAEWKILDAKWYEIFAKAGMKKVFKIYLKLDPEKHEVRAMDQEYTVSWKAGVPSLTLSAYQQMGQIHKFEFTTKYAFTETGKFEQVYKYKFNTKEIKKPIQDKVISCGWTYKGVILL